MGLFGDAIGGAINAISGLFGGGGMSIDTSAIEEAISQTTKQIDEISNAQNALNAAFQPVANGGWIGLGQVAFVQDFQGNYLPAIQDLLNQLNILNQLSQMVLNQVQEADNQAKGIIDMIGDAVDAIGDFLGGL